VARRKRKLDLQRVGEIPDPLVSDEILPAYPHDPLQDHFAPGRVSRIEQVLALRTRNLALLIENVWDPHNIAACLRSADAFGVQDVHVVEQDGDFELKRKVAKGAERWLDIHRYRDTPSCLAALAEKGYRVYASDLSATCALDDIDFTEPTVLAFGNEHAGATPALIEGAHGTFVLPMRGFAQSLNVSVAVALCLYHAVRERTRRLGALGDLSADERLALRERWLQIALRRGAAVAREIARRSVKEAADAVDQPLEGVAGGGHPHQDAAALASVPAPGEDRLPARGDVLRPCERAES
jgi:tRNA (guanosine-2'-O-)-methyltransferase